MESRGLPRQQILGWSQGDAGMIRLGGKVHTDQFDPTSKATDPHQCVCLKLWEHFPVGVGKSFCCLILFQGLYCPCLVPTQIKNESALISVEPGSENYKTGSLEILMDQVLPSVMFEDTIFVHDFLGNYQHFTTTEQVLNIVFTWWVLVQYPEIPNSWLWPDNGLSCYYPKCRVDTMVLSRTSL
jgi:predicted RNA-binding protein